jgi:MFS family permease
MLLKIRRKNLFSLSFIIFLESFSFLVITPTLYRLCVQPHFNMLPVNMTEPMRYLVFLALLILPAVGSLLAALFVGSLSDYYGRKPVMLIGFLLVALALSLQLLALAFTSMVLFAFGRILLGVGVCVHVVARAAIADVAINTKRMQYFSIYLAACTLALCFGPLVGIFLSDVKLLGWFDISTPFWLGLAIALFNLVLLLEFFHELPGGNRLQLSRWSSLKQALVYFKRADFVAFIFGYCVVSFGILLYVMSHFYFLHEVYAFSAKDIGKYQLLVGLVMTLSLLFFIPMLANKYSLQRILAVSLTTQCSLLLCNFIPDAMLQWLIMVLLSMATSATYAAAFTYFMDIFDDANLGVASAFLGMLFTFAWLMCSLLVPYLSKCSIYKVLIFEISLLALGSVLMCWAICKFKRKPLV